jgi:hypothetical protein
MTTIVLTPVTPTGGTTITRATLTTHLATEFAFLAAETGQVVTDTTAGFGPALDRALRAMGVAETALATATVVDANVPAVYALAEYFALLRFQRALAVRGDIDGAKAIGPRAQIFQHVRDMLADAVIACQALGYDLRAAAAWEFAHLTLDYIEPEAA